MSVTTDITHYPTKNDYLQSNKSADVLSKGSAKKKPLKDIGVEKSSKVDLSEGAKEQAKNIVKSDISQVGKAVGHLAKDAVSSLKNIPGNLLGGVSRSEVKSLRNAQKLEKNGPAVIRRPGVFFIKGLDLISMNSSGGDGLKEMSGALKGSKHYSWSDEDKIIEQIKKRPPEYPIILVGHSLGGDTAVKIANRLNSLENGFRRVDLLVTLDSVGFNNDIIPQNVIKNLNFISDDDAFFNDGPNIARNNEVTEIINNLLSSGHSDIDESQDVQFKIFQNIAKTVSSLKNQLKA